MLKSQPKMDEEYEVDCAVDTLAKAEEIKKDPELMAKVVERAKEKHGALKSIAELRVKASQVRAKKDDDDDVDPELLTDDDKAAMQDIKRVEKSIDAVGIKKASK